MYVLKIRISYLFIFFFFHSLKLQYLWTVIHFVKLAHYNFVWSAITNKRYFLSLRLNTADGSCLYSQAFVTPGSLLGFRCYCVGFTALRHFSGHFGRGQSLFLGKPPRQFTSLSPVTDNCPSWISGRERMAVEIISWPISTLFGFR